MKALLSKANKTEKVKFMGTETVEVRKLNVAQVREFQKLISKEDVEANQEKGLDLQRYVIRAAVVGAEELTDEEMDSFPLDDLSKLVNEILTLAGVRSDEGNASPKKN
jgi:hypothetical protein